MKISTQVIESLFLTFMVIAFVWEFDRHIHPKVMVMGMVCGSLLASHAWATLVVALKSSPSSSHEPGSQ